MIEECLCVNLEDLTDNCIETIYSETDENGNDISIKLIDFNSAGKHISSNIAFSEQWSILPLDDEIKKLFTANEIGAHLDFEAIKDGYFVVSGVSLDTEEFDFNCVNFDKWYTFEVGIWDANAETLYFISITKIFFIVN